MLSHFVSFPHVKEGTISDVLAVKRVPDWVPGAFYQRAAKQWAVYVRKLKDDPLQAARERVVSV